MHLLQMPMLSKVPHLQFPEGQSNVIGSYEPKMPLYIAPTIAVSLTLSATYQLSSRKIEGCLRLTVNFVWCCINTLFAARVHVVDASSGYATCHVPNINESRVERDDLLYKRIHCESKERYDRAS